MSWILDFGRFEDFGFTKSWFQDFGGFQDFSFPKFRAGVPTPASRTLRKAFFLPSPRPKPSQIQAAIFFFFFLFYANQAGFEPVISLFANSLPIQCLC